MSWSSNSMMKVKLFRKLWITLEIGEWVSWPSAFHWPFQYTTLMEVDGCVLQPFVKTLGPWIRPCLILKSIFKKKSIFWPQQVWTFKRLPLSHVISLFHAKLLERVIFACRFHLPVTSWHPALSFICLCPPWFVHSCQGYLLATLSVLGFSVCLLTVIEFSLLFFFLSWTFGEFFYSTWFLKECRVPQWFLVSFPSL